LLDSGACGPRVIPLIAPKPPHTEEAVIEAALIADRHASIRQRLMNVVMTTTLLALLASAAVLLVYEMRADRAATVRELRAQAEFVTRASLPVQNRADLQSARDNLALLRHKPLVDAAGLYDANDRLVAGYAATDQPWPPRRLEADVASRFGLRQLELRQPVLQEGRLLGTLVLHAHYDTLPRLLGFLVTLGVVTLGSLALAALVAQRLQRRITEPIVAIAAIAREVVQTRNFGLRAPRTTHDEVGALVDAFNDMLRELGDQAAALRTADRRKDEFLATLAHELRNPLAPIATALAILPRADTDRATLLRLVDMMQRQMKQFVRLIDELMEVSRISTGRLTLHVERMDLVEVVRAAAESVGPALLERRHSLAVSWPDAIWLEGDRTRLSQVFVNLLGNAVKYTQPGGRIGIDFELGPETVDVCISDNGLGIAPERQAEVFEMFMQVDRSPARGARAGLGVGLSVARQLVGLHHGSLTLHSDGLGHGSVFIVRLPRLAQQQVPPPPPPAAAPVREGPASALRVLLADDNVDFAESLAVVLRNEGHEVRVAHDGNAALQLAREAMPEVGLFDIGMPGLDGYQLAAALRREPGGADCLLVAITGWGQEADRQRAREAGFDEHLVKPVDVDQLLAMLARTVAA
jgi:signal transduction histidine kinase